ncbi:hypothetical protein WJX74_001372 [Apatococcus lobatus]|uniref:Uncharacterized protein n=1 Tax=Apatococcus lobatus TaxID=904363 RepID=A0AAW1S1T5_9CHLO
MPTALNGQLVSSSCAAASSVLSAYPRGAYTSGLLLPSGCLAGWQQHSHRLALSLQVLADAGLLDGPEASQQQLAAALEAAGFMPAQAWSELSQPLQLPKPDWWHQLEQLMCASVRAARSGLHPMPTPQHDSQYPAAVNDLGGGQASAAASLSDNEVPLHCKPACQYVQQTSEPQKLSSAAILLGHTSGNEQAADSIEVLLSNGLAEEHHQGTAIDPGLQTISRCVTPEGAQIHRQQPGSISWASSRRPAECTADVSGVWLQNSIMQEAHSACGQVSEDKQKQQEIAITILIFSGPTESSSAGCGSTSISNDLPYPCRALEPLPDGVRVCAAADGPAGPHRQAGQNGLVLNVMAHAVHYDRSKVPASVEVCVVGPPRSLPAAKDSRWPADRAHLQARMPPGAAEGILSTADGRLLEGFITNLFIISGSDQGLRVEAAAEEEGVLGGIMRAQVLQACRRLAVPVKLSAPCSSSRLSWKGAFLSNSLRGIQQVHSICNNERTSPIRGNWRVDLQMDMVIMSLISQIKAEIAHALSDGSSEPAIGIC